MNMAVLHFQSQWLQADTHLCHLQSWGGGHFTGFSFTTQPCDTQRMLIYTHHFILERCLHLPLIHVWSLQHETCLHICQRKQICESTLINIVRKGNTAAADSEWLPSSPCWVFAGFTFTHSCFLAQTGTTQTSIRCQRSATRTWTPTWQNSHGCTWMSSTAWALSVRFTPMWVNTLKRWVIKNLVVYHMIGTSISNNDQQHSPAKDMDMKLPIWMDESWRVL